MMICFANLLWQISCYSQKLSPCYGVRWVESHAVLGVSEMSRNTYPLFSPNLMQVNSFDYAIPSFRHSIPGERTSGAIGYAVDEAKKNKVPNVLLSRIDLFIKENGLEKT